MTKTDDDLVAILDSVTDAMFRLDRVGVVTMCNRSAQRIVGPAEALVGTRFVNVVVDAHRDAFGRALAHAEAGTPGDNLFLELHRTDGRTVPVMITLAPDRSAAGAGGGSWVIAHDLTEQGEYQRALAENERRVRRSEVLAGTGTFVVDAAASVVQWSPGMYTIFGVAPGDFEPSIYGHLELVHPADRRNVEQAFHIALRGGRSTELDHGVLRNDGSVGWVFLAIEPTHDASGHEIGASGVCQDVTQRKLAESTMRDALERERSAAEELRQLDRVKEGFLATVSHELRTPLTAILGFASLLRDSCPDHDQLLAPIERNASDMHQMVERILDYSRLEAGRVEIEPRPVVLAEWLGEVLEHVQSALAGREVEVDIPADLVVRADPEALDRILVNLITNAAKYSEPPAPVRVSGERVGRTVVVSVSDQGPGIDGSHHARIFERFFRVPGPTAAKRGTGVGLAIVRQYVELHGGKIWLDSALGKGTTFHFELPDGDPM
ncbi:MAG TPA: ATP-binding protein [Sporichthya sp.]|nr:ATP-binding protein [Sporichthya sp.]